MIRPARPSDAAAIAAVEAHVDPAAWSPATVERFLALPTTVAWVVAEDPVAHLLTTVVIDEAEVLTVAVHPAHRRRGHAARLLAHARAAWIEGGVVRAHLEVREDNAPARALYEHLGWSPAGRRPRYYRDGTDALLMHLELP